MNDDKGSPDLVTEILLSARDWVYDHYQAAYVLGTSYILWSLFGPDLRSFGFFWAITQIGGYLLEPCVNPHLLRYGPGLVRLEESADKQLALTFDDGPGPDTPLLLDLLAKHQVIATFFLIGEQVAQYPEMVKRIYDAGHKIGNHTWTHPNLMLRSKGSTQSEFLKTQNAIEQLTGERPQIFRPPYGFRAPWTHRAAKSLELRQVLWSLNPRDFQNPGTDLIVERVKSAISSGTILLLHDGRGRCPQTLAAVDILLPWLKEQGYQFVGL
jgi:peptidoglycan-N-acetylglucosamine deacetylase